MFCKEVKLEHSQGRAPPILAESQWPIKTQLFQICPPQTVRHRLLSLMLQPTFLTQTHKSQFLSVVVWNSLARIVLVIPFRPEVMCFVIALSSWVSCWYSGYFPNKEHHFHWNSRLGLNRKWPCLDYSFSIYYFSRIYTRVIDLLASWEHNFKISDYASHGHSLCSFLLSPFSISEILFLTFKSMAIIQKAIIMLK